MYSIDRLAIQKMKFGFRSSNIRIKFTLNNWCLTPSRVQNNWQFLYDYSFYPSFFPILSNSSFQFRLVQFIATFGDYPTVLCFEDDIIIILSLVSLRHIHPATILALFLNYNADSHDLLWLFVTLLVNLGCCSSAAVPYSLGIYGLRCKCSSAN